MSEDLPPPESPPLADVFPLFATLLKAHLARLGESQKGFAIQAAYSHRWVQAIANGQAPVPLDRVEGWVAILKLEGPERFEFIEAAHLSNTPVWLAERYMLLRGAFTRRGLEALGVIQKP